MVGDGAVSKFSQSLDNWVEGLLRSSALRLARRALRSRRAALRGHSTQHTPHYHTQHNGQPVYCLLCVTIRAQLRSLVLLRLPAAGRIHISATTPPKKTARPGPGAYPDPCRLCVFVLFDTPHITTYHR